MPASRTRTRTRTWLRRTWPLLVAVATIAPSPSVAAPPELPPVKIEFERYRLDNGMEVILHPDRSAPRVAVNVWYHVGSGNETPGKSGFAHLFEHMMFQGAKHIGSDVHFDILREIGATGVNGSTNPNRTNYYETVPSNHLETALWLESDRMGYMLDLLDETSLQNQRDVVRNERRQNYDDRPYGRERFAVAAALYPEGHPYRYLTIGKHEDIEGASLDDVRQFFLRWYVPSNATLTLAGDFDVAEAKAMVDKWFGSFPRLDQPKSREVKAPKLAENTTTVVDDPRASSVRLHWAWHSPPVLKDGDMELGLLGDVLDASGWGRLDKRLVIDEQVAQYVSAYQDGDQRSGAFHVVVGLRPDAKDARARAEAIVKEELAKALSGGITQEELDRVKLRRHAGFVWALEELNGRAERLQWFNHFTGNPGYVERYLEDLQKVTTDDIKRVSSEWLQKPSALIVSQPAKGEAPTGKGPKGDKKGVVLKKKAGKAEGTKGAKKSPPPPAKKNTPLEKGAK